ncbi:hypothetical protein SAMN05443575_0643 [Jatrophihabitans endophyticus]|uniref:DUF4386 domain-containing protein n=1 Tax=Jatrophihabitans endophyticus TaxID=1206085 RepID=A0A1M5DNN2_9ACTN|nr:hypothetical protein [Jatrophihabitans endophyticus]SHF68583.1 hypothetical protein SAMN05443575_0643 [Jatrophihabitans endophyticus]
MTRHPPQAGPPLPVPAAVALALTIACGAVHASGPRPDASPDAALAYLQEHHTRMHLLAFLVFATAVPLAVYSATAYRRLRRLGVSAPGAAIALVGGTLAAASLALSGLVTWVGAHSAGALTGPLARVLLDLAFATGGVGFATPLGLLLAGAAVPVLVLGLGPRWLGWAGLLLAVVAAVVGLALLFDALAPLLPVVRFGGLAWLVALGVTLPRTRRHRDADSGSVLA